MAKFLFTYHGGAKPETEAEQAEAMHAWGNWMNWMGQAVVDGGNPVGQSKTVLSDGSVADDGGANPVSGYGLFSATDYEDALIKAKGCPILTAGGSVEVSEAIET